MVVIGAGPTGLTTAILLGQRGWRVTVVERAAAPADLPRAVHFDHEAARVFALAGVGDAAVAASEQVTDYEWRNGDGRTLLRFDWRATGPSGWPAANMFHQPDLERLLEARVAALPAVRLRRGQDAVAVAAGAGGVTVDLAPGGGRLHARYLVGADGAGGATRSLVGTAGTDLGFFHDWLVVDVVERQPRRWEPVNLQVCDPSRPTTAVSGGPGRRRWEFMRLPGEPARSLADRATAWRLLAPWGVDPSTATLERSALYTYRAAWVDRWRRGRLLLAGDAAHLMPPFAGQGMCSGVRDAANLAWKLDLVLAGRADEDLLDSYGTERADHVRTVVEFSIELGKVICITDPAEAAARDTAMSGGATETAAPPVPALGAGVVRAGSDPLAGTLSVQGRVRAGRRVGLLDEVAGAGLTLLCAAPPATTPPDRFIRLGGRVVPVLPPGAAPSPGAVVDVDGVLTNWLSSAGRVAALVRPDFYTYGSAASDGEVPALIDEFVASVPA